jgi:hypothetical protein
MWLDADTAGLVSDRQSAALLELVDCGGWFEQGVVDHPGNLVVFNRGHGSAFPSQQSVAAELPFTIASEFFPGIGGKLP